VGRVSTGLTFESITVEGFRGVSKAVLSDCQQVNILVGDNNSGKTSMLEAILLMCAPKDPGRWRLLTSLRGGWPLMDPPGPRLAWSRLNSMQWLFPLVDGKQSEIKLASCGNVPVVNLSCRAEMIAGEPERKALIDETQYIEGMLRPRSERLGERTTERGIEIRMQMQWNPEFSSQGRGQRSLFPPPDEYRMVLWEYGRGIGEVSNRGESVPTAYASPISHRSDTYLSRQVSRLLRLEKKEQVLELIKEVDPRIDDFSLLWPVTEENSPEELNHPGDAVVHLAVTGVGLVPIQGMGDGLRRALHLACLVAQLGEGGVLVIDEVEVGMHTSVLKGAFSWLVRACKRSGVQLFATTHSLEAVDAMLASSEDDQLALFRLEPNRVRRYGGKLLQAARTELGQEVR